MLALGAGAVARRRDIGFVEGLHLVEHEERGPDDLEAAGGCQARQLCADAGE